MADGRISKRNTRKDAKSTKHEKSTNCAKETKCAICLKKIIERSDNADGEDLIFCKGDCQRWLHRSCAGLPDPAFDLIHNSTEKFYCFPSSMVRHTLEVKNYGPW